MELIAFLITFIFSLWLTLVGCLKALDVVCWFLTSPYLAPSLTVIFLSAFFCAGIQTVAIFLATIRINLFVIREL